MTPYQKLVAARKCTQCRRPLAPGEKKKCETCIAANRAKRTSKAARARDRQYARKSYAKDPETKRQAVRAEKDRKKREHECRDCPNPAEPDADHCADHTEKRRKYAQRMWRKEKAKRNRERREAGRQRNLTRMRSAAINSSMEHTHPAPNGSPFVRGCPECERQWIAAGIGPVERMKPLGFKEPAREIPEPDGDASEAGWDRADYEAERATDAAFTPADAEKPRHDEI